MSEELHEDHRLLLKLNDLLGVDEAHAEIDSFAKLATVTEEVHAGQKFMRATFTHMGATIDEMHRLSRMDSEYRETIEHGIRLRVGRTAALLEHGLVKPPEETPDA